MREGNGEAESLREWWMEFELVRTYTVPSPSPSPSPSTSTTPTMSVSATTPSVVPPYTVQYQTAVPSVPFNEHYPHAHLPPSPDPLTRSEVPSSLNNTSTSSFNTRDTSTLDTSDASFDTRITNLLSMLTSIPPGVLNTQSQNNPRDETAARLRRLLSELQAYRRNTASADDVQFGVGGDGNEGRIEAIREVIGGLMSLGGGGSMGFGGLGGLGGVGGLGNLGSLGGLGLGQTTPPPATSCFSSAWSADGSRVCVASQEGVVVVWDVRAASVSSSGTRTNSKGKEREEDVNVGVVAKWETRPDEFSRGGGGEGGLPRSLPISGGPSVEGLSSTPIPSQLSLTISMMTSDPRAWMEENGGRAPSWCVRSVKFSKSAGGREVLIFTEVRYFVFRLSCVLILGYFLLFSRVYFELDTIKN